MASCTTNSEPTRSPRLLAVSMIATPVLFFAALAAVGPLSSFALYLFVAWTIAAITSTCTYVIDSEYIRQFSRSEQLAMLAANGMVALLVAFSGYAAFGFG